MNGAQLLAVWMAFFVGAVVGDVFVVGGRFYVVVLGVALVCAVWWRGRGGGSPRGPAAPPGWLLPASLACLALLAGAARMQYAQQQFVHSQFHDDVSQTVELTGQVVREPDVRDAYTGLYVAVDDEVLLVRASRFVGVQYGDTVMVSGDLDRAEPFLTGTGRVFDYPTYLRARGVQHVVSFADVQVTDTGGGNYLVERLYTVKGKFADAVEAVLPPPQSDLGLGLLLGIKQNLGEDLEDAFRRTGLIHIVVLSGYNVMLVIAFFWWVTAWVLPLRGRVVVSVVGIVLFAIMVGLSATVVRASIMAGILLLAKYIGARYDVLRALLFAGLVMVALNPYLLLYDLGFQLSFMATLGLVLFLPQFEGTVATETRTVRLRDIFLATCVTQLFVLPLLIYHIGEVSLVAVVVNVLVLPIVAVAMGLTFVTGLLALVSTTLATSVALLANLVLSYIIVVVQWFDSLPWAAASLPPISIPELLGLYALIALLWYTWYQRTHAPAPGQGAVSVAGWQIVEDVSDGQNGDGADVPQGKSAPPEPPVFFR